MNELRYEDREIRNYGRLAIPGDRGELCMISTPRGRELRWVQGGN